MTGYFFSDPVLYTKVYCENSKNRLADILYQKRVCLRMLSRNFQKIYNIGEVLERKNTSKRLEAVSSGILVDSVLGVGQISSPNRICESPRPFSFSLPVDFVSVAKGELSYEQNVQCHLE